MATTITGTTIDVGPNKLVSDSSGNVTASGILSDPSGNVRSGRKNLIINGGMQAWQRATSASAIGYTSVDRWSYYAGSSLAISRSTDVPTGFQYATSVGGGGSDSGLTQKIEASSCKQLVGATITVSFYLKQTTGAGTDKIAVALARANSEDNFGGTTSISTQTVSTTTSYARYTCTFTSLPTEVSNGLQLSIKSNGAGSVVYLITGIQLELGSTATDFEHRSYGEELALCQRYYETLITKENQSLLANGFCYSNTQVQGVVRFSVDKRVTPTMGYEVGIAYQSSGEAARTNITPLFYIPSTKTVMVYASSGVSVTAGQGLNLVNRDDGTGMIFADAEL